MGRQHEPGTRPRRVVAKPSNIQLPSYNVGATLYRPLCVDGKRTAPTFQRPMARPQMRGLRMSTPSGHRVATRGKLLQPAMVSSFRPLCETTPIGGSCYRHRTALAPKTVVLELTQLGHRDHPLPRLARPVFPRSARLARGGRTTMMEHRGFSTATPAWLHSRRGAIGRTLRTASSNLTDLSAMVNHPTKPSRPVRNTLREPDAHAPWTATMTTRLRKLLGTDQIGTTALHLLSSSLVPTTYSNYDIGMRQFASFCHEENIHPLQATT
jgi:hypothetical protein